LSPPGHARLLPRLLLPCVIGLLASPGFTQDNVQNSAAQTWTVNFNGADIRELIRFVADATGRTLIVDPLVQGTVEVVSSTPVDSAGLYNLFLSILDVHNLAAIESGNVVRIVPAQSAPSQAIPVGLASAANVAPGSLVTQVIQVGNVSVEQLVGVLRPLASPEAQMTAYAASNSIIVTDSAANIERIRQMVDFIDSSSLKQTELIPLTNASADAVVDLIQRLRGEQDLPSTSPVQLVADARTNSILVTGEQVQIRRMRELIGQLDTPLTQDGKVNVVYLQYARAEELAPLLNEIVQQVASAPASPEAASATKAGTITADAATNALIITADSELLQTLRNVIARLDIRRAQVLVEAIIVELSGERGQDLGVQWLFLRDNGVYGSSSTGSPTSAAIAGAALGTDANGNPIDIRGPLGATLAGTPGQLLGVGRLDNDLSFNVLINALQADDSANILSTPSLLTLDNAEAVITVGRNVPFVTGSFTSTGNNSNPNNPFQTIERQNVGVTLRVTPHINEGDSLVLELSQEVSSLLGAGGALLNSNPITNERIIQTTVLANDAQTVILGGLIEDNLTERNQRVPLLGDIPGLGRLFRNDSRRLSKTHLVVFLRATIMRDERQLEAATGEKYRFIRNEQLQRIGNGVDFIPDDQLPLLPEWEALLRELQQQRASNVQAAPAAAE
jgi:general secretion pathway protein D